MKEIKENIVFNGKELSVATGRYARQADGAIWLKYGGTVLLATTVSSKEEVSDEIDFFPLTVDYIEKFYAAGKFPGGFLKRESQPSTEEKLTSRLIDRPLRPMFPDWFKSETQVLVTLLSYDSDCDPKGMSIMASSAALMISDIPFHGPVAGCRVVKKDGEFVVNPSISDKTEKYEIDITIAGNRDSIVMVEGEALEAPEDEITAAIEVGHKAIQPLLDIQESLAKKIAPVKRAEIEIKSDELLKKFVEKSAASLVKKALATTIKLERYSLIDEAKKKNVELVTEALEKGEKFNDSDNVEKVIKRAKGFFENFLKESMRGMIVKKNKRIDGRDLTSIRPITIDLGVLPKVHGSAIFTRGETQSLGTITLGIGHDEQRVDTVTEENSKNFMLHYNFPGFSVGEVSRLRSPGRRELGHGNLAERALSPVIPSREEFPYTIRVVSEILESNGSSSQATVCSGSLALMNAGIPFKKHVAGIAMGLIKESNDYFILSDILGDEDHLGDMDFKVAGTKDGITAIQMDIKIEGLPKDVMERAMIQAKVGRMHIIGEMEKAIQGPNTELNPNAPKLFSMKIEVEKIKDLIGTGGKNIKSIVEQTGADVEVEQDGTVKIAAKDQQILDETIALVKSFTDSVELGKVYEGEVTRVEEYGAFVEIMKGTTGLLHISKIAEERVENVTDHVNLGDKIRVIVTEIEFGGKFKLSMKPSDFEKDWKKEKESRPPRKDDRKRGFDRGDRGRDRDNRHR
ncbi:MAG: polyribonucleotide nucleotidyltransferase [bacterium]